MGVTLCLISLVFIIMINPFPELSFIMINPFPELSFYVIIAWLIICYFISYCINVSVLSEANNDRSKNILDRIGGVSNIDINLSKYCDENQLIILKDKTIHIGYNNYETEKIIRLDSIIDVDIIINNSYELKYNGTYYYALDDNIKSITVHIHTNEYTESLNFKFLVYKNHELQLKYHEILKDLTRFKAIINTNDSLHVQNQINKSK